MEFNRELNANEVNRLTAEQQNEYFEWLLKSVMSSDEEISESESNQITKGLQLGSEENECSDIEQEPFPIEVNEDIVSEDAEHDDNNFEYFQSRDGTKWKKSAPPRRKYLQHNILSTQKVGPTSKTKGLSMVETFNLFFTPEIKDIIMRETNRKAEQYFHKLNQKEPSCPPRKWDPMDIVELDAYIGIVLFAGVNRSNKEHLTELWTMESSPFYRAAMESKRFRCLTQFIRFDNSNTRNDRLLTDKAAPITDIWLMLNANLESNYVPGTDLTVDEQLFPFRGRTRFTQYIPSKPAKYGIKVWWVCDAKTSYPLKGQIYTGLNLSGERETNQGERVVKELVADDKGSGRNVTCDNFFTTLNLAQFLLQDYKMSILGTVNKKRKFIPAEFLITKGKQTRSVNSSEFGFTDNVTLCSYVPKKQKCVVLLSTSHYSKAVSGINDKPDMIIDYNKTKGGVDNMDKMIGEYTCKRRTQRWPLAFFYNMLDIGALASYIVYYENNTQIKTTTALRRKFLKDLCKALILPSTKLRAENLQITRHFSSLNAIEAILNCKLTECTVPSTSITQTEELDNTGRVRHKGNCYICTIRRSTRKSCVTCRKPVCAQHSVNQAICSQCK